MAGGKGPANSSKNDAILQAVVAFLRKAGPVVEAAEEGQLLSPAELAPLYLARPGRNISSWSVHPLTLDTVGESEAMLSLRQEGLRAVCGPQQEERSPERTIERSPKRRRSQAGGADFDDDVRRDCDAELRRVELELEDKQLARPSLIPSLCTRFTRAGIEWRR